jgi:regulator of RNase E activity RraA
LSSTAASGDAGAVGKLGLGVWVRGVTPNYHAQTSIIPFAVNVPIACGNAFVVPGDIVVADDDGAVVVPVRLAEVVIAAGSGQRACGVGGVFAPSSVRGWGYAVVLPVGR